MYMMKKVCIFVIIMTITLCLTGCRTVNEKTLAQNLKKIELTGNLVTHQAYFHNVIEHEKKAGTGLTHLFEKKRKLFAEYTGTVKLGIDLSQVKMEVKGNAINVLIPKAIVIGEPNVDEDDFKSENFIESKDGINKNEITADDSSAAFDEAQREMKEYAANDSELLSVAQTRAKVILEENIKQFSKLSEDKYIINWEYQ